MTTGPAFYYDVGSPYAWLTAERIEERLGPVEWAPVLLGGLFAATGRSSWARTDARSRGMAEVEARALRYGLAPVVWPASWPNDGLLAMRAAAAAAHVGRGREYALAAMRLQFTEGRALSEPRNVRRAAQGAGIDPDELLARATSPAGKSDLRSRTDAALGQGVFGVPTVIAAGELHWGDDRLDQIPPAGPVAFVTSAGASVAWRNLAAEVVRGLAAALGPGSRARGVTAPPGVGALRIWRTRIDPSRAAEYERFAQERSLPMFRRQPGFRDVVFAGDGEVRVVLTFWADARDAVALAGSEDYRATVASIEAAGFLRPPQDVELLEVQAAWPRSAQPPKRSM